VEHRRLGKTGFEVSAIGVGTWAMGSAWGDTDDAMSMAALHAAVDAGVNLFDTADVYGDGRSERLLARLLQERKGERLFVLTKMGRKVEQRVANYHPEAFRGWIAQSLENLGLDRLDLIQLHCPPTDVYYHPELFAALDELVDAGLVRHYGVSVERVEEALKALEYPGLASVQIIFNMLRQRPADTFLAKAAERDVGVIVRVPLASGLLSGKLTRSTVFADTDHRSFNRHGEAFDVGETFAGVDYETGLEVVEQLRPLLPGGATMAQFALRWVLMHPAVSTAIPGARSPEQARSNAAAADLPPLPDTVMERIRELYDRAVKPQVHQRW
jgi:aryl-alcohol dehydrogenase-like predicted oxidoreductase